jgi:hypothetical protein
MDCLYYDNKPIKTKNALAFSFKKEGNLFVEKFSGNKKELNRLLGVSGKYSFKFLVKITNVFYKNADKNIFSYLNKCGEKNFSVKRYNEYKEYRKINKHDSFSEKYYLLIYGRFWKKYFNQSRIRNNPLDPKYVSKRDGISLQEAKEKAQKLKEAYKTSEENFIAKYGNELGTKKYNEFVAKVSNNSVFNLSYWINKGFSKKEAQKMRDQFFKNNTSINSVDFWQKRGLSSSEARAKVKEICLKRGVSFMSASKQSLAYFHPLNEKLRSMGYNPRFGINGNSEFSLWDEQRKKLCFYDFTVPELKIIIEFNGDRFHPNPKKLSAKEWANWQVPYTDRVYTADEIAEKDAQKMRLAKKSGYDFLVIWSSDSFVENMAKITKMFSKYGVEV